MLKSCKITKVRNVTNQDFTIFLDNNLEYKNGSLNYITFVNRPPFNRLKEGDYVTVKTEMLVSHPTNSIFNDTEMITLGHFGTESLDSKNESE